MALTIEILEFLRIHPEYWKEIIGIKDLKIINWNLMAENEDIEEGIRANKILLRHYDKQIQIKEKQLGLPSKY